MSLPSLAERSPEIAVNLNPALTAKVIWHSVCAFAESQDNLRHDGMPFLLAFLILPLVLHEETRDAMPPNRSKRLQMWLSEHGEVLHGFSERTRWLAPYTREGLIFGANRGILLVPSDGLVKPGAAVVGEPSAGDETKPIIAAAKLVGRWFAQVPAPAAVFQMLGVKP